MKQRHILSKILNNNVDIEFIDELYRADMNRILQQLQKVNERYNAVILIAHNPGVDEFSMEFIKENQALLKTTVPASIAYFTVECNLWPLLERVKVVYAGFLCHK